MGFFVVLATLLTAACAQEVETPTTSDASGVVESPTTASSVTTTTEAVPETVPTTEPPETVPTTWQPLESGARVLIIGDSISLGYTTGIQQALPSMEVVHHEGNARSTKFALDSNRVYSWLGDQTWDVIHFNFGLHDLSYIDAQGNEVTAETTGSAPQVSLEEYENNLEAIVGILNETGARLIWATTTPVYETSGSRLADAELAYNEAALRVMTRNGIQINDLHSFAEQNLDQLRLGGDDNVHFSVAGYDLMADAVVEVLLGTPT